QPFQQSAKKDLNPAQLRPFAHGVTIFIRGALYPELLSSEVERDISKSFRRAASAIVITEANSMIGEGARSVDDSGRLRLEIQRRNFCHTHETSDDDNFNEGVPGLFIVNNTARIFWEPFYVREWPAILNASAPRL
ncbi:hypothetical protein E4U39_007132, partial [Claviceps sp. Clav50 group G5]